MTKKSIDNELVRCRYRIGKQDSKEIIAIRKICEKKVAELTKQHGKDIKFSKIVLASTHPYGAPHV